MSAGQNGGLFRVSYSRTHFTLQLTETGETIATVALEGVDVTINCVLGNDYFCVVSRVNDDT
jgi:hypothetical protein